MLARPAITRRQRLARRVLERLLLSPVSLGLTTAALVLATDPATWLPAGALAAVNGVLIFLQARSPSYVRRVAEELHRHEWRDYVTRAEELQRMLDPAPGNLLASIVNSQERLLAFAAEGNGAAPSRAQCSELLRHCVKIAEKRLDLSTFLAEARPAELEREADYLRAHAAVTEDAVARRLFEQARDQKLAEIENMRDIQHAVSRIDGQLTAVDATYDNLLGKIMRLRLTQSAGEAVDEDQVLKELTGLTQGVAALEASLAETFVVRSSP
jgi:hypothetical protein